MPQVIEAVTSGTLSYSANSYCTLAWADEFFSRGLRGRFWREREQADREDALIEATWQIESLLRGQDLDKYDSVTSTTAGHERGQPLQFPRSWDRENTTGTLVVPPDMKKGQALLALHLLREHLGYGPEADADMMAAQGFSSSSQDGVSVTRGAVGPTTWPIEVQRLVFPFWQRGGETTEDYTDWEQRLTRWRVGWVAHS